MGTVAGCAAFLGALVALSSCDAADAVASALADDPSALAERIAEVEESRTVLSQIYHVDREYRSMKGPFSTVEIRLGKARSAAEELYWITGYRAVMVGPDGATPMPQQYMCHSNLDLDVGEHIRALGAHGSFSPRLFTLSQGQLEIDFPAGFGIPVRGDEALDLTTQVLNLNPDELPPEGVEVRHRVTLDYVPDAAVRGRMRALQPIAAYGLALLAGQGDADRGDAGQKDGDGLGDLGPLGGKGMEPYFDVDDPDAERHGPGCLVGETASDHAYEDRHGREFTGHWLVPPGRQVNRTLVTELMKVPYETRIHYVAVHLHPFAESLELRDLTTGETLFRSEAENFDEGIGLERVEAFSSAQGVPIHSDHEYELVSVYENTSGETQDSMAVMYIYVRDLHLEEALGAGRRG